MRIIQIVPSIIIDCLISFISTTSTILIIVSFSPYFSFPSAPYLVGFPSVILSAFLRGLRGGMLTTVGAAMAIKYLLLSPGHTLFLYSPSQVFQLMLFLTIGFIISLAFELLKRAYIHTITEHKIADDQMKDRLAFLSSVIEGITDQVFVKDISGRYLMVNNTMVKYIRKRKKEILGKTADELFPLEIAERIRLSEEEALATGKTVTYEMNIPNHDTISTFLTSKKVYYDADNTILGFVGISHDITERKNYEERLSNLNMKITNILQSISDAFFALDTEGKFVYLNNQAEKLLNAKKEKIIGKSVWSEFPQIIDATFYGKYLRVLATHKPLIFEKCYKPMHKWFEIHAYPGKDGLSVYLTDITVRKESEEALRENEERFRLLSESVPQIIWTAEANGEIDYYNKRWYEYTNLSYEQSRGRQWKRVIHQEDIEESVKLWERSLKTGKKYESQARLKRARDSEYIWHLIRAVPIKNSEQKIVRWFGTCTDINEQKKIDERKDEFISTASHELKTPLTTVKALTQLLQKRFKEDKFPEVNLYLYKMDQQLNKFRDLINNLLDVSKIQAGNLEFVERYFDMSELIYETVEEIQTSTNSHTIVVKGVERNCYVYGDRYRIGQVLTNLLSNAIKYSPNSKKVSINVIDEKRYVTIAIEDFGIGIPHEEIKNIFERFYRIGGNSNDRFEGLGLGLHLVQEIIRMHKGKIWVKSEVGAGSTFYFSLPVSNREARPHNILTDKTYGSYEKARLSN